MASEVDTCVTYEGFFVLLLLITENVLIGVRIKVSKEREEQSVSSHGNLQSLHGNYSVLATVGTAVVQRELLNPCEAC